jgi:RNA polymerase sigma-70 factor, ECF subfamily
VTDAFVEPAAKTLMARAEADEGDAGFAARVAENQRRVFQIAYSVLGNAADAEEIAQEAFLRAFRKSGSLREADKFRAWVGRIAFRLALNRRRGQHRQIARDDAWHGASPAHVMDGEQGAEDRLMIERMREEIFKLPERLRAVLLLSLAEEMDASAVGEVLGIPAGTVRSRLHAARKLLLEAMQ